MNEKIKTILRIVKNGYIPLGYYTPQGSINSWGMSDEELQKFAELIIRECIQLSTEVQKQTVSNGSPDYISGREMGIEVCMNKIKEEFGVE